jgi:hypothetical protein
MPGVPDFTVQEWQGRHSDPQLKISILDGKGASMPPWRGRINPELAQNLVRYVREFDPAGRAAPGAPVGGFDQSFDALQKELDALKAQMKELSRLR